MLVKNETASYIHVNKAFFNGNCLLLLLKKTAYFTYSFEKRLHFGIVYKIVGLQWSLKFIREKQKTKGQFTVLLVLEMCLGIIYEYVLKTAILSIQNKLFRYRKYNSGHKYTKLCLLSLVTGESWYKAIRLEK